MSGPTGVPPTAPDPAYLARLVTVALDEDLGGDPGRDVTTAATVPDAAQARVLVRSRSDGVLAGGPAWQPLLADAARRLGQRVPQVELLVAEGAAVSRGDVVAVLTGPTRTLLVAERSGLNLVGRACGVATHTRRWVDAVIGTGVTVLDTRKTTPGLRAWEKYAVRCGGGVNKRCGLDRVAMVKDNHVAAAGSVVDAFLAVRRSYPDVAVEVEVDSGEQALAVVAAGATFVMCDNMSTAVLAETVRQIRRATPEGRYVAVEATGGLTLDRAREVALTGVDHLSVGALTHSSSQLDLGLDFVD